ncbi:MAG: hypothetical protein NDJ90_11030 [Oligoflexia bacterium]|nr:hypothetical protein [Oligoflexia bacterium]
MLTSTLASLSCPRCTGPRLELRARETLPAGPAEEIRSGELGCPSCGAAFPILAGIAVLVEDVGQYLQEHVKGIAQIVPDEEIPEGFLEEYLEAKVELATEHIEEDLEAERVNALYLMNHYLHAGTPETGAPWWQPRGGGGDPLIDALVRRHWDQGPFARIGDWAQTLAGRRPGLSVIELGCGVGGLEAVLRPHVASYLGVDSSFASVALARHLALGFPYPSALRIPEDLLAGSVSRELRLPSPPPCDGRADFVVGDLAAPPLRTGLWDLTIALNAIDMLDEPASLPALQWRLLKSEGIAVQSCPYIWHPHVAAELRARLPEGIRDSARAVEWLYTEVGFRLGEKVEHLPWLFFKHVRQLELYSVHLFMSHKRSG